MSPVALGFLVPLGLIVLFFTVWFIQAYIRIHWTSHKHYDVKITQQYDSQNRPDGVRIFIKRPMTYDNVFARGYLTRTIAYYYDDDNDKYEGGPVLFKHASEVAQEMIERHMEATRKEKRKEVAFTVRTDTGAIDNMRGIE